MAWLKLGYLRKCVRLGPELRNTSRAILYHALGNLEREPIFEFPALLVAGIGRCEADVALLKCALIRGINETRVRGLGRLIQDLDELSMTSLNHSAHELEQFLRRGVPLRPECMKYVMEVHTTM